MSVSDKANLATETVTEMLSTLASARDADGNLLECFDALRGEHEWAHATEGTRSVCFTCLAYDDEEHPPYCLRTDLGALLDVLTACGLGMRTLVWESGDVTVQVNRQETDAVVFALTIPEHAKSVRDVLAKAIVAAVPL